LEVARLPLMRPNPLRVPLRAATADAPMIVAGATVSGAIPAVAAVAVVTMVVRAKARAKVRDRARGVKATVRLKVTQATVRTGKAEATEVVVVGIAAVAAAIAVNSMVVRSPAVAATPRQRIEFALANRLGWRAFEASAFADAFFVLGLFVSPFP
jgi:hypothetical protein